GPIHHGRGCHCPARSIRDQTSVPCLESTLALPHMTGQSTPPFHSILHAARLPQGPAQSSGSYRGKTNPAWTTSRTIQTERLFPNPLAGRKQLPHSLSVQ